MLALSLDVTNRDALGPTVEEVERVLGSIDISVNNAGVATVSGGVLHEAENTWDTTMATHLTASFLLSKRVAASMVQRRSGKIINLASMYSYFGSGMIPSYSAAKGAVVQLTKSMARELAPHNIQVNAIAPGWIATDMTAMVRDHPDFEGFNTMILARTPANRWGDPVVRQSFWPLAQRTLLPAQLCPLTVGTPFFKRPPVRPNPSLHRIAFGSR